MTTNKAYENAILANLTKGTVIASPGVTKVGLASTGNPGAGTFTPIADTILSVPHATWGTANNGAVANTTEIRWPAKTGTPYGNITHWVLYNASDEPLLVFQLTSPRAGDPVGTELRFRPGELMMTITVGSN